MTKKTVSFHDDPPEAQEQNKYREALQRAKQSSKDRPGDLTGTPRFDQTGSWENQQESTSNFLSPDTKRGLENLAIAAKQEERSQAKVEKSDTKPEKVEEVEKELTADEKLKKAIESRLEPIDIGEYLMSGEVRQTVPIIPNKLVITYKTVSDLEESFVDNTISAETAKLSNRQFLRKMNELALVIHIHSVNGNKWPSLVNGDGTINEASVESRLKHIQKLSSPIFNMMTQNLAWFTDRVSEGLTSSALGNG